MTTQNTQPYSEVRHLISNGDLLLFRGKGILSRVIGIAGRSRYSHAGMACWWHDDLFLLEVQRTGGRAVSLSTQIEKYPGQWDLFATDTTHNLAGVTQFMRQLCGCDYGFSGLAAAALLHLPVVRWFVRPSMDNDACDRRPPFCSQACAMAYRLGGGIDPVPQLPDRLTEPGDLARSQFFQYRFTLL